MPNHDDEIRVLRLIEYVGKRSAVENTLKRSLGPVYVLPGLTIRTATLGNPAEILKLSPTDRSLDNGQG